MKKITGNKKKMSKGKRKIHKLYGGRHRVEGDRCPNCHRWNCARKDCKFSAEECKFCHGECEKMKTKGWKK